MTTPASTHVLPVDRVLNLWAKNWPAIRIARYVRDENGNEFTENAVRVMVLREREKGNPLAIHHRPGAKKKDWRG